MADIAIDDIASIDDIREKIREKSEYLYANRYKQKIIYLKEYLSESSQEQRL
jgi:hypothetical protein